MTQESGNTVESVTIPRLFQPIRQPAIFKGDVGQDPTRWLKEYERVANFNGWDDTVCLANAYFFLEGTARQWYENNEAILTPWAKFQDELKHTFGDKPFHIRRAKDLLKCRAQKPGENTQSYIQSVLELCHKIDPSMSENDKLSHLMKGVAEDMYQALLAKEISAVVEFIKWCQHIDEMHQKRIGRQKFARLPNVIPMASVDNQEDLVSIIRQIVREEVQRLVTPAPDPIEPQTQSIQTIIKEEVERAIAPISGPREQPSRRQRQPTYAAVAASKRQSTLADIQPRKAELWRTTDDRPICFHCGRPGHVLRYCRERKAVFDACRVRRGSPTGELQNRMCPADQYSRIAARTQSPSPARGRSPTRRYRSTSPYQRSSQSPNRGSEEN